ncbi:MAG: DUF1540 domain-containing protein [Ignavibacteriales bacterium]
MKVARTNHPINRVKCVVNTCEYHQPGDNCLAENIEVRPKDAKSNKETDCATFTAKD